MVDVVAVSPAANSDSHSLIDFNAWENLMVVGKGGSSTVYKAYLKEKKEYFIAVKQIETDGLQKGQINGIKAEIETLQSLCHPNIVSYLGAHQRPNRIYILLEYADGGSLRQYYQKHGCLDAFQTAFCLQQILTGLNYLHSNGLAHRDIKCANCLLTIKGNVKLADFGASKRFESDSIVSGLKGTPHWMAPEVIKGTQMTTGWMKADVWSLGCTVVEMFTGKVPYAEYENPMTAMYKIASGEIPSISSRRDPLPLAASDQPRGQAEAELATFLRSCCQANPMDRPTAEQLLSHPFLSFSALPSSLTASADLTGTVSNAVETHEQKRDQDTLCPPNLNPNPYPTSVTLSLVLSRSRGNILTEECDDVTLNDMLTPMIYPSGSGRGSLLLRTTSLQDVTQPRAADDDLSSVNSSLETVAQVRHEAAGDRLLLDSPRSSEAAGSILPLRYINVHPDSSSAVRRGDDADPPSSIEPVVVADSSSRPSAPLSSEKLRLHNPNPILNATATLHATAKAIAEAGAQGGGAESGSVSGGVGPIGFVLPSQQPPIVSGTSKASSSSSTTSWDRMEKASGASSLAAVRKHASQELLAASSSSSSSSSGRKASGQGDGTRQSHLPIRTNGKVALILAPLSAPANALPLDFNIHPNPSASSMRSRSANTHATAGPMELGFGLGLPSVSPAELAALHPVSALSLPAARRRRDKLPAVSRPDITTTDGQSADQPPHQAALLPPVSVPSQSSSSALPPLRYHSAPALTRSHQLRLGLGLQSSEPITSAYLVSQTPNPHHQPKLSRPQALSLRIIDEEKGPEKLSAPQILRQKRR